MRHVTRQIDDHAPADLAGILDDLDAAQPYAFGPPCGVKSAIDHIAESDAELAEKVRERVEDKRYPASKVAAILAQRTGVNLQDQTVRRHRRRGTANGCRCPK